MEKDGMTVLDVSIDCQWAITQKMMLVSQPNLTCRLQKLSHSEEAGGPGDTLLTRREWQPR